MKQREGKKQGDLSLHSKVSFSSARGGQEMKVAADVHRKAGALAKKEKEKEKTAKFRYCVDPINRNCSIHPKV